MDEEIIKLENGKNIATIKDNIDLSDTNYVLNYGTNAQKKIAQFSDKTLDKVKTSDLDEIGNSLSDMVKELKSFDLDEKKGLARLFGKMHNQKEAMLSKYRDVETNVDVVKKVLEEHQRQLLKDIEVLDEMYRLNLEYHNELLNYIDAGHEKLDEAYKELALKKENINKDDPVKAQELSDFENNILRFEKKIHDLELTKTVSLQMAPQIRMIQSSNTIMAEKISSTLVNTIPLWKSQMVISLGATHSLEAARVQKEVSDFTNELLKSNAEKIKMASINSVKEAQRDIVDIETIKNTNQKLIEAITEVRNIQIEGRKRRRDASLELEKIETELKNSLINVATKDWVYSVFCYYTL